MGCILLPAWQLCCDVIEIRSGAPAAAGICLTYDHDQRLSCISLTKEQNSLIERSIDRTFSRSVTLLIRRSCCS